MHFGLYADKQVIITVFPVSGCGRSRFRRRGNALIAVAVPEVTVPPLLNWDVVLQEHTALQTPYDAVWVVAGVPPIDLNNNTRRCGE